MAHKFISMSCSSVYKGRFSSRIPGWPILIAALMFLLILLTAGPTSPATAGQNVRLKFIPELTIGQESGDENFMFGHISYIDVDPGGNIYIADSKNRQVRVFDRDGRFLRKIAVPQGQGPQELNQISGIAVTPSGLLFINGDRKMIVYDGQGNYLRTFKVDFQVSCIRSAGSEEVIGIGPHEGKILHVFDFEGRLLSSFGEVLEVPKDFEPMKMMPMFGAPLLFSASKDGRVFVLNPHRYQVLVFKDKKLEASLAGSNELYEPLTRMGRGFVSTAAIILPAGKLLLVYFESFKNQEHVADLFIDGKQVGSMKLPGELKAIDYQGKLYMVIPGEFPRVTRYSVSE